MIQPGNTPLVCTSVHHQNTSRIAHAMTEMLEADCVSPAECPYPRLIGVELLGIGSGIYYGRVHEELRPWARDLPDELARDATPVPSIRVSEAVICLPGSRRHVGFPGHH